MDVPLVSHFVEMGYKEDSFKFFVLYVTTKTGEEAISKDLLQKEITWIFTLKSLVPNDWNASIDYTCFYVFRLWSDETCLYFFIMLLYCHFKFLCESS